MDFSEGISKCGDPCSQILNQQNTQEGIFHMKHGNKRTDFDGLTPGPKVMHVLKCFAG